MEPEPHGPRPDVYARLAEDAQHRAAERRPPGWARWAGWAIVALTAVVVVLAALGAEPW